ncbi:MAG: hypothetical protein ACJ746_07670 [Bryobacteraceae bacterium]
MNSRYERTLVLFLITVARALMPNSSPAQNLPTDPPQRAPKPIEPPHKPAQQGFRLAATIGFNFIGNAKYSYNTAVTMPDGTALNYSGTERSSGGTLSLGAAATPGGAFRRFTLGFDLNFGGLDVPGHPVVPPGTATPFSQSNLNSQVAQKLVVGSHWHPFISPYIEHEIGSILQNRVRLGYEYLNTSGSASGVFAVDQSRSTQARYSVRFGQATHMIRLSVHNDSWFDDTEPGKAPPKRRSGIIQQGGVLVGTDGTVMVFVRVGPVWTF